MPKNYSYRGFYEHETERALPSDFDIHHVDFNRLNNSIENLVALPNWLHKEYHSVYKKNYFHLIKDPRPFNNKIVLHPYDWNTNTIDAYVALQTVLDKCEIYLYYKNFLLGIPGINFKNHLY